MGLDGLPRPTELMGYTDNIARFNRSEKIAQELNRGEKVVEHERIEEVDEQAYKEEGKPKKHNRPDHKEDSFDDSLEAFFAEEFNLTLDPSVTYRFFYNEITDRFELLDTFNQKTLLVLSPEAFYQINDKLRYGGRTSSSGGLMTDKTA